MRPFCSRSVSASPRSTLHSRVSCERASLALCLIVTYWLLASLRYCRSLPAWHASTQHCSSVGDHSGLRGLAAEALPLDLRGLAGVCTYSSSESDSAGKSTYSPSPPSSTAAPPPSSESCFSSG